MPPNISKSVVALGGFALACLGVLAAGGALTASTVDTWYLTLDKPWWTPGDYVFTPVWATLFGLMAVSAWLVWRAAGLDRARGAMALFALQLGLNLAWSALFFGLRSPLAALVDIALLLAAVVATVHAFARHSRLAAALLLPYLAWVGFASALNAAIWWLNR